MEPGVKNTTVFLHQRSAAYVFAVELGKNGPWYCRVRVHYYP